MRITDLKKTGKKFTDLQRVISSKKGLEILNTTFVADRTTTPRSVTNISRSSKHLSRLGVQFALCLKVCVIKVLYQISIIINYTIALAVTYTISIIYTIGLPNLIILSIIFVWHTLLKCLYTYKTKDVLYDLIRFLLVYFYLNTNGLFNFEEILKAYR